MVNYALVLLPNLVLRIEFLCWSNVYKVSICEEKDINDADL